MSKEAMKLACKALRDCHYYMINAGLPNQSLLNETFTAYMEMEAALAKQPAQQEPVATITITQRGPIRIIDNNFDDCVRGWPDGEYNLYTFPQPAQRPWVGLTDEERKLVRNSVGYNQFVTAGEYAEHVQKATEFKLLEKNT